MVATIEQISLFIGASLIPQTARASRSFLPDARR
jgi:hypothetical protein